MVRRCILCCSASNTHKDLSFHQFPKNEIIRSIWIDSLSIKEVVKDSHRICSTHFSPDHYTFKNERKILKLGAIPKKKEMKDEVGSCGTSLEHDANLMSNSLIEVDCCPDIDISNESAPSTSKSLIEVDCCPDIDIFNESAPSTSKRKEVKDEVGSCETSLDHDVNLMCNSLIEVDCCPDIDISNESAPSTSERLKSLSKNTKKTYKVVNSEEVTSPIKSNKCKRQTSDKEDSINETPQSVDKDVETYVSNNYVSEDGGKKLEVFDSLDDHTSEYRTMTDTGMMCYMPTYDSKDNKYIKCGSSLQTRMQYDFI
ncbi:unnamed protein product [Macrosiphum euphorbiae]|uniref:THAP-type domain-containing protein n=1 Tax=Macrosiphum euphorbiae TaxID=13131 RepID=A0AAV0W3A8_9HEMI|nr:unnamed protein product [Macrosiphum euphorbiae]